MLTFKEYLKEMMGQEQSTEDPEDMNLADTKRRAQEMVRRAQMRDSGNEKRSTQMNIRDLTIKMRNTKDPIQKRDLNRRIQELRDSEKQQGM